MLRKKMKEEIKIKRPFKLLLIFAISLLTLKLVYSECIDETTTTVYGETCSDFVCDSSYNGNCIDFHCAYSDYSDETADCRDSCNLKECKSWDTSTSDSKPKEVKSVCCKFDISDASCKDTCTTLTEGTKIVRKRCANAVCS